MTVNKLIEVLKSFPQDATVVAGWDGGWSNLDKVELGKDRDGRVVVVFDVEEYGSYCEDEHGEMQ